VVKTGAGVAVAVVRVECKTEVVPSSALMQ
jgi:hypothetical protein